MKLVQAHLLPALLATLVFFTTLPFLESAWRVWERSHVAVEWEGVEVLTPVVKPGGVLEMVYSARVHKQCPSDLRGFITKNDETVPVRIPAVTGGYVEPGAHTVKVRVKIKIPEKVDPGQVPWESGEYYYRATATRYCPEGVENDSEIPDARFRIEVE